MSIEDDIKKKAKSQARKYADGTLTSLRNTYGEHDLAHTDAWHAQLGALEQVLIDGLTPEFERKITKALLDGAVEMAGIQ